MIFPKHPKLMTDNELCNYVKFLIERQAPESSSLDYKAEVSIKGKSKRIEIAKDVTSFGNEEGGIIVYGVPQTEIEGVPIPEGLSECGVDIPDGLPSDIENILLDIVRPSLPELFIKVLSIEELRPKSLLMIHHPESWNKPHMVEGYGHARYYRRGNYRAIVMNERQIEALYASRMSSITHAENFFQKGDFRTIPEKGRFLRTVVCSRFPLIRRQEMSEEQFKQWLDINPPGGHSGDWLPFLDGWSFRRRLSGDFHGNQFEFRLFHNGGICFNMDLTFAIKQENFLLDLKGMEKVFGGTVLPYVAKAYEFIKISGPLFIQVSLYNVKNLSAMVPSEIWFVDPEIGTSPIEYDSISFVEDTSVDELKFQSDNVLKRLINRLASAFGIWRK